MPQTISIRRATQADTCAVVRLLSILFAQEAEFKPEPEAQARGVRRILATPDHGAILVGERDNEIIGSVTLLFTTSTATGGEAALLEDLIVSASARGQGLGRDLLRAAIALCEKRSCTRITLLTDADNSTAQALYLSEGFTRSPMVAFRKPLPAPSR